jgi:hypothetical protein
MTAVSYLIQSITNLRHLYSNEFIVQLHKSIVIAHDKEKEQIINAFILGKHEDLTGNEFWEYYYE